MSVFCSYVISFAFFSCFISLTLPLSTCVASKLFFNENIEISFENYKQIEYSQLFGDFIPNLSICDMIFNIGSEKTMSYILKK